MTTTIRQAGVILLALMLSLFVMLGSSPAQAQDEECYPVPPGGCEVEPECADIIAAIMEGDVEQDQNGDGLIDEADLPASCTCEELIDAITEGVIDIGDLPPDALSDCGCEELIEAIAAGAIDPADLPDGLLEGACSCDEIQAAIDAGTLDESLLPEDCGETEVAQEEEPEEEPVAEVIADTGFPTSGAAMFAVAGLLAGVALLVSTRKTA